MGETLRRRFGRGCAVGLVLVVGACSGRPGAGPGIEASSVKALIDAPIAVTIRGLPRSSVVTVAARAADEHGIGWASSASFRSATDGTVSLADPPLSGSYVGRNPMGLFETMTPSRPTASTAFVSTRPGGSVITLTATVGGRVVATTTVDREQPAAVGVTEREERLADTGIYADLFLPRSTNQRHPAVLVVGGSEGGLAYSDLPASLLAAHGYPALALAYFAEPGLPSTLANIPLEYFARALQLLSHQPGVDPQHVMVWGTSRGSEAALQLGADYPGLVHGVIASVPSSTVDPGFPDPRKPAWTWHGKPVATVSASDLGYPEPTDAPSAIIAVEKIQGPLMTICGGQDQVWPSCSYAAAITSRLEGHRDAHTRLALSYPNAGHLVGDLLPYVSSTTVDIPEDGATLETGGTPYADATARDDAWPRLLAFLATAR